MTLVAYMAVIALAGMLIGMKFKVTALLPATSLFLVLLILLYVSGAITLLYMVLVAIAGATLFQVAYLAGSLLSGFVRARQAKRA